MSLSELCICELCGASFNSWARKDICSICAADGKIPVPGHKKNLEEAKTQRQNAKSVGLKAVTGSPKQKSWGETIRKQLLDNIALSTMVTKEDALAVYHILGSVRFKSAHFWIEQRNDLDGLQSKLVKAVQLKSQANAMHANGQSDTAEYQLVASRYHDIIDNF